VVVLYYFGGLYYNKPRRQGRGQGGEGAPIDTLNLYWLAEESRV
jgi:hypothetical protein